MGKKTAETLSRGGVKSSWKVMLAGFILLVCTISCLAQEDHRIAIVIHGGAGTITRSSMTPDREAEYRSVLEQALNAGYSILQASGSSLDAAEAAVRIMEDSPLFNAGKGAVFTSTGTNELDAAIMDGATLKAGSVAALKHVKNPVTLARMVMERSKHVMMVGEGAEDFGRLNNVEMVDPSYFHTEHRRKQLEQQQERERMEEKKKEPEKTGRHRNPDAYFGTVAAVALDRNGNLAAAISTGGTTNKRYGRVGDTPIIGAGIYADNRTAAVAATGTGEYFMRSVASHELVSLMAYEGMNAQQAADSVIHGRITPIGGDGGIMALDRMGNIGMSFNTEGMYRGYIDISGRLVIQLYKE